MKVVLLLALLGLTCLAMAEAHNRKTLAPTPAPRTAGAATAAKTTIKPTTPVQVGQGNARVKSKAGKPASKAGTGAAKMNTSQNEACNGVNEADFCDSDQQFNCCSGFYSGAFQGCEVASNLYTCSSQFDDKPIAACCN